MILKHLQLVTLNWIYTSFNLPPPVCHKALLPGALADITLKCLNILVRAFAQSKAGTLLSGSLGAATPLLGANQKFWALAFGASPPLFWAHGIGHI
jgi:hypothetical protein